MRIAFASGKGGAGKTMLTAALHAVWPVPHLLVDADVEAPNLQLFLKPWLAKSTKVEIKEPTALLPSCTHCGACREICRYGAIACFGEKIVLFPEMCHGCGGCFRVCKSNSLSAGTRELGEVFQGRLKDGSPYFSGRTRIGEVMTPPVLRKLFAELDQAKDLAGLDVLVDSPPGISCPMVLVARQVDCLVLVVDPTPFGLADFSLAKEAFQNLGLPVACVLNRVGQAGNAKSEAAVESYCFKQALPVLGRIPFSRQAAACLAQGNSLEQGEWTPIFVELAKKLRIWAKEVGVEQ
ncbi:MAG: (4Fe-4S)-binding protein, partial [Desulfovibrio sp.]|nr:(4Fe-4S)-binding protein [Desulfovibrio sp.]